MIQKTRVLLVDDHHLVRAGIRALVEGMDSAEVIAEASDGQIALQAIGTHRPDLVLMDISMPIFNGLEVTERVVKQFPQTRVIILSMYANEEYVLQAMQAGAAGYLMKDADINELQRAIQTVMSGQSYLSPTVSQHVTSYLRRVNSSTSTNHNQSETEKTLTPRQVETLKLIADGYSTKQIADALNISVKTAESHRANIMKRLKIYDVAGLVRYALRHGLIED